MYIHTYARCPALALHRKCAGKGIGQQGVVLKQGNCLQEEPVPCRPMPLLVQLRTTQYLALQYNAI